MDHGNCPFFIASLTTGEKIKEIFQTGENTSRVIFYKIQARRVTLCLGIWSNFPENQNILPKFIFGTKSKFSKIFVYVMHHWKYWGFKFP